MAGTRIMLLASAAFTMSGCAATISAYKNRAVNVQDMKRRGVYTLTGDRRMAVVTDRATALKFCAESLPDAAAAIGASSSAGLGANKVDLKATDAVSQGLLQTFQRTEVAEVLRQLGWNTCLAWAQNAIDDAQYHALLEKIVDGSIAVMKTRAGQPLPAWTAGLLVVAGGDVPTSTPKASEAKPVPAPSPTPAPSPSAAPTGD